MKKINAEGAEGAGTTEERKEPNGDMEVRMVLRSAVAPDKEQPRQVFDEAKLQELAESIKAVGIRQPLQVRSAEIEVGETKYVLIDGERRWRAAELAGVERVPVLVVDTSGPGWAKEKLAIQVVLNQQHENLSALEEAAAYRKELESGRHTAESLYQQLGVSRAHLFGRLALNRLPGFAVEALKEGRITTSVAGLIPMIPKEEEQKKFIEAVAGQNAAERPEWREEKEWKPEGPMSFRGAQDLLEEQFCVQLKGAPFDTEDAELFPTEWVIRSGDENCGFKDFKARGATPMVTSEKGAFERIPQGQNDWAVCEGTYGDQFTAAPPNSPLACGSKELPILVAGLSKKDAKELAALIKGKCRLAVTRVKGGACTDCPFRSGNLAEYPEAAKRPNVCTQPQCYHQKVKAHWVRKAGDAVKAGQTVIEVTTYKRTKGQYVEAEKEQWIGGSHTSAQKALGKKAPPVLLATTAEGLIKVYKREEAVKAGLNLARGYSSTPKTAEEKRKEEEAEEKAAAQAEQRRRLAKEHAAAVGAGIAKLSEKEAWALVAELVDHGYDRDGIRSVMKQQVKTERDRLLCDVMTGHGQGVLDWKGKWEAKVVARWKRLGVDLVKLEENLQAPTSNLQRNRKTEQAEKVMKAAKGKWAKAKKTSKRFKAAVKQVLEKARK